MIDPSPMDIRKLYVIVREDLPEGLRAAQAGHAIAELCLRYPERGHEWRRGGNHLIVLGVRDEDALMSEWRIMKDCHIIREWFCEPDLQYQMTALAAFPEPSMNFIFSHLHLAYSRRPWWRRLFRRLGA